MKPRNAFFSSFLLAMALGLPATSQAEVEIPIMDLVDVQGIRENQLVGYGLVVGLAGQGDRNQVKFTAQSITNMLRQFGVQIDDSMNPKLRNVASVSVTASVDPMAGPGQTLDVVVSSIGDAKSLRGGTLLLTPLRGIDGEVYAIAQGGVVVGGLSAEGKSGSKVEVNTPTAGRIPNGATIEREIETDFNQRDEITLNLRKPSFTTAKVSQPNAFADGKTEVVDQSQIDVNEDQAKMVIWPPGTELNTIVNAVNSLGATPTDLMSILQALNEAGALNAELVVI